MPIKFRCQHCRQFLGISQSKAGTVVDCPTCGRQIRVPQLDGRVEPVPIPRMNLQDSELTNALDALAGIDGEAGESNHSDSGVSSKEPAAAATTLEPAVVDLPPLPSPEPVTIEAPLPAVPVALPDPGADVVVPESDPLEGLSRQAQKTGPVPTAVANRKVAAVGLACLLVGGLSGFLIAPRGSSEPEEQQPPENQPIVTKTDEQKKKPPPPPPPPADAALHGTIRYTTSDDKKLPDKGARVIAFPAKREGVARLSIEGFRPSAEEIDVKVARAALNALGGDIAVADENGRYHLKLRKGESYRVLVISRFQQDLRAAPGPPPTDFTLLMQSYFLRSKQFQDMLSRVRYLDTRLSADGQEWNHDFVSR